MPSDQQPLQGLAGIVTGAGGGIGSPTRSDPRIAAGRILVENFGRLDRGAGQVGAGHRLKDAGRGVERSSEAASPPWSGEPALCRSER